MRRTLWPLVLPCLLGLTAARAASWEYTISVPDGREATFELPFEVEHEGTVTIEASWIGPRLLFFGVEGPDHAALARRSGPSPQRLELSANPAGIVHGTGWILTIKALPARGEAEGKLRVTVPDAPAVVAKREAESHPPPPPPPPPPTWATSKAAPIGSSTEIARVYETTEALRVAVLATADVSGDACGWQLDFLKFAVATRDKLRGTEPPLDLPTLRYVGRLAQAVRSVELLRSGTDPVIAGPVPADRDQRHDWLIARAEIVRPIERSLDELTELLHHGYAPALEDEPWLPKFTACLTACERFYDDRVRFGGEGNAPNREVAGAEWSRILAAERVLSSYAPFLKEPVDPGP